MDISTNFVLMVLSRFWLIIFISSLVFILVGISFNQQYSIDSVINGKKDDPVLIGEKYLFQLPNSLKDTLKRSPEGTVVFNANDTDADTTYVNSEGQVRIYSGLQKTDGLLPTAKSTILDIILPLLAYNFAANFLGLDSAATPFGLKAMESLQEINPDKDKASDAQIMFLCLHAAGLTLIPTSIIGYRAAEHATNPADVMLPCIITSFIGTIAALIIVGIRQRVNLLSGILIAVVFSIIAAMLGLLFYIGSLDLMAKNHFTSNFSGVLLIGIILLTLAFAFWKEKRFSEKNTTVFDSFVVGAKNGMNTAVTIFPYVLGMLVAISVFRNSGMFELLSQGITWVFSQAGLSKEITDSLPVAMLRPFSSGGSRGFMLDAMRVYGPDSFTGRLSCIFQCSAETTFYVVAVYFGAIKVKNTRYTLSTMLLVDLVCVIAAIFVASWFF